MTTSGGGTCAVRVVKYKVARVSLSSPVTGAWLAHAVCVSSRLYSRGFFLLSVWLLLLSRYSRGPAFVSSLGSRINL